MTENTPINLRTLALLLVLPVIGVPALALDKQMTIAHSTTVRLPITGFDPRHYMYGHFLRFRFAGDNPPDAIAHDYYVPEDAAPALDNLLRKREHTLSIDVHKSGTEAMNFGALYIDDVPWRDYLSQHPDDAKQE